MDKVSHCPCLPGISGWPGNEAGLLSVQYLTALTQHIKILHAIVLCHGKTLQALQCGRLAVWPLEQQMIDTHPDHV